jgi:hypothetical protein
LYSDLENLAPQEPQRIHPAMGPGI